jgi:hypothetical protein
MDPGSCQMGMPFVGGEVCGSCQMGMPFVGGEVCGGGLCPALGRIVGAEVCGCGKIVGIVFDMAVPGEFCQMGPELKIVGNVFDMAYSSGGTGQLFA